MGSRPIQSWVAIFVLIGSLHAASAEQWILHNGAGFKVESPPDWTVWPDAQNGWVHLIGTQGETVVIWPVFLPGGPASLDLRTAQLIHQRLVAAGPYHADWEAAQPAGVNTVRARGKSGEMAAVSAFAWKETPRGIAGCFYLTGARLTDFASKAEVLSHVLRSFRLLGNEQAGTEGGLQYVPFTDPLERAFVAEVPAGWQTSGGLVRSSPDDPHLVLGMTSPDGQTRLSLGDPQMSTYFQEPMGVFPEGAMNGPSMVLRYLTGAYFCRFYVSRRAPMVCSDLQFTDMRDNPELMQWAVSRDPSLAQQPFSIGSVKFQCREQGQLKNGFCQALTQRPFPAPGALWRIQGPVSYLAPPERAEQAMNILNHVRDSINFNPQWGAREVQQAGIRSGIISGAGSQIGDMMAATRQHKDAVEQRIAQMRSDATLGVVRLADPVTGRQITVDSGANYYWVDPGGRIAGTQVDTLPGIDFRRLIEPSAR